jgi:hypothetical protein
MSSRPDWAIKQDPISKKKRYELTNDQWSHHLPRCNITSKGPTSEHGYIRDQAFNTEVWGMFKIQTELGQGLK